MELISCYHDEYAPSSSRIWIKAAASTESTVRRMPASERTKEDASISPVEYKRIGIAIVLVKKTDDQNSAPDVSAAAKEERNKKSVAGRAGAGERWRKNR